MALVIGLRCIRCDRRYAPTAFAEDCPVCRHEAPSSLAVVYEETVLRPRPRPDRLAGAAEGGIGSAAPAALWRFGDTLPVTQDEAVTLGEGGTPLHRLDRIGADLGLSALYGKDESRNPTGSFKDRMAAVAVSTAVRMGARVIASSSSGNAGAAVAAYAAKAGLPCIVFTFEGAAGPMVAQMRAYGALVLTVRHKADRWTLLEAGIRKYGWFPTSPFFGPVVGSNPYGVEGYKTLAYEITEQLGWSVPDWCVLPVCYGDALAGMWRGFDDQRAFGWTDSAPRMAAAEIYGSLGAALEAGTDAVPDRPAGHKTIAGSIGATQSTFQALVVLRRSGGSAGTVGNDELHRWHDALARREGLYVEATSAASLALVARLRQQGVMGADDRIVVLLTASGLKDDPSLGAGRLPDLPVLPDADLNRAVSVLASHYGFEL